MKKIDIAMLFSKDSMPLNEFSNQLVKGEADLDHNFMSVLSNKLTEGIPLEVLQSGIGLEGNLQTSSGESFPVHLFQHLFSAEMKEADPEDMEVIDQEFTENNMKEPEAILPISIFEDIPKKLDYLVEEISQVLEQLTSGEKPKVSDVKLLPLLKEYVRLKRLGNELHIPLQPVKFTDPDTKELFQKLTTAFERRSNLAESGKYMNESIVNEKTLTEWLQNILKDMNVNSDEKGVVHTNRQGTDYLSMPMTKTEQFVIHVQRQDQDFSTNLERQILQKFEQAIRTTQFLRANNGPNQLIFHLKPENLGEMMVRLVEIDGEMTAKIIVTSESTRRALQSNIHQLKTMFSPHQVVIEKQEELAVHQTDEPRDSTKEEESEQEQFFNEQEKNESEQNQEKEKISFKDLLVGKV